MNIIAILVLLPRDLRHHHQRAVDGLHLRADRDLAALLVYAFFWYVLVLAAALVLVLFFGGILGKRTNG